MSAYPSHDAARSATPKLNHRTYPVGYVPGKNPAANVLKERLDAQPGWSDRTFWRGDAYLDQGRCQPEAGPSNYAKAIPRDIFSNPSHSDSSHPFDFTTTGSSMPDNDVVPPVLSDIASTQSPPLTLTPRNQLPSTHILFPPDPPLIFNNVSGPSMFTHTPVQRDLHSATPKPDQHIYPGGYIPMRSPAANTLKDRLATRPEWSNRGFLRDDAYWEQGLAQPEAGLSRHPNAIPRAISPSPSTYSESSRTYDFMTTGSSIADSDATPPVRHVWREDDAYRERSRSQSDREVGTSNDDIPISARTFPIPSAYSESSHPFDFTTTGSLTISNRATPPARYEISPTQSSTLTLTPHTQLPSLSSPNPPLVLNAFLQPRSTERLWDPATRLTNLLFDLRQCHDSVLIPDVHLHPLKWETSEQPATIPPCTYLRVVHRALPWPIHARAGEHLHPELSPGFRGLDGVRPPQRRLDYVSVMDVLRALYTTLHVPLTRTDFAPHEAPPKRTVMAFYQRCRYMNIHPSYGNQEEKGMRRVDVLGTRVQFIGLVPTGTYATFRLMLADRERDSAPYGARSVDLLMPLEGEPEAAEYTGPVPWGWKDPGTMWGVQQWLKDIDRTLGAEKREIEAEWRDREARKAEEELPVQGLGLTLG